MALIEGIRIQNYCALRDVTLGRIGIIPEYRDAEALTPLTVVIGKNGAGKSSIFDAFGQIVWKKILVWILRKGENGFSFIQRVSEIPYVKEMVAEGQPLGALWYSDYLD